MVGATGAQGGGLVRAIDADTEGSVVARALTRNPDSARARALTEFWAEVVRADLDDVPSLEAAFAGAYAVFGVTDFWEHRSPEKETAQARALAHAVRGTAGVQHVIWSTLEDPRRWVTLDDTRMPTLLGKYKVPHFDAKGQVDAAFAETGIPTTYLLTSFHWDNLIHSGMGPRQHEDGILRFRLPMGDKKMPEDAGHCRVQYRAMRLRDLPWGATWTGKQIGIAGDHLTGAEMASSLGDVLGPPVVYEAITPEAYRGLDFPGAEDMGNMFQFMQELDTDFRAARNVTPAEPKPPRLPLLAQRPRG